MTTIVPPNQSSPGKTPPRAGDITTIIFDIGNVLINWDPRHLFRKVFADEARMEHFLAQVCTEDWNREQDRGRSFADAVAEAIALHPGSESEIRAYDERWHEMLDGEIKGSVDILTELQARGWPTFGLTNFSTEKFVIAATLFPFLKTFDGVLVSGEEKLIKPDPAIFRLFLSRFGRRAEECFFTDDNEQNVAAAKEVGIHAFHFVGPERLAEDLRTLGIL